jgi:hypothetical protein
MSSFELSGRVGNVVAYPPLVEMDEGHRQEFQEALLDAHHFEDLSGKWQAAILEAAQSRPEATRRQRRVNQPAAGRERRRLRQSLSRQEMCSRQASEGLVQALCA